MAFLLETPRLRLRPVSAADVDALHALWMHPEVRRFLWDDAILPRAETAAIVARSEQAFAERGSGLWVATSVAPESPGSSRSGDVVPLLGFCGYWHFREPPELELLYGLARDAWRRGLATEMARAMLGLGYGTLGMAEVQASTDAPNRASVRVMERLGMRFHRRLLDGPRETVVYRLHRTEFRPEAACQGTHGDLRRGV